MSYDQGRRTRPSHERDRVALLPDDSLGRVGRPSGAEQEQQQQQQQHNDGASDEDEVEEVTDDGGEDGVREPHELDCPLCRALMFEPITTACGHNFCRSCLVRALDYSNKCPVCRSLVFIAPNHPVNSVLGNLAASTFPTEYRRRTTQMQKENRTLRHNMPLFVLNVVMFPGMLFHLHVFEPRYQAMISQALASPRCFGIINGPSEVGCVVEITRFVGLADGRSLVSVKGKSRFRVKARWQNAQYGYEVAKVKLFEDVGEDANDNGEVQRLAVDLRRLVHEKLSPAAIATLEQQIGPMPTSDPQAFSFWTGAYLEGQDLLEMTSVYQRLLRERAILTGVATPSRPTAQGPETAVLRPFATTGNIITRGVVVNILLVVFLVVMVIWSKYI